MLTDVLHGRVCTKAEKKTFSVRFFFTEVRKAHSCLCLNTCSLSLSYHFTSSPSFCLFTALPLSRNMETCLPLHFPRGAHARSELRNLVFCLYWEAGLLHGTMDLTQGYLFSTTETLWGIMQQFCFHQSFAQKKKKKWGYVPLHILMG